MLKTVVGGEADGEEELSDRMRTIIITSVRQRLIFLATAALTVSACGSQSSTSVDSSTKPTVVATHSVLGAIVSDLVADGADVKVLIPNGIDPHEWEPSAKDVEAVNEAALVIANGLNLEEGLDEVLDGAEVPVFFATDHIATLVVSDDHSDEEADGHGDEHDGRDPHFWTDPVAVADVVEHLAEQLAAVGIEVTSSAEEVIDDLARLDAEILDLLSVIPTDDRVMITGHVSMAYFATRYDIELLGSVVPSLSTSAEATAANLSDLKDLIADEGVSVIFAELGAADDVVSALASETGVRVTVLSSHRVPETGTYRSFLLALASEVLDALTA